MRRLSHRNMARVSNVCAKNRFRVQDKEILAKRGTPSRHSLLPQASSSCLAVRRSRARCEKRYDTYRARRRSFESTSIRPPRTLHLGYLGCGPCCERVAEAQFLEIRSRSSGVLSCSLKGKPAWTPFQKTRTCILVAAIRQSMCTQQHGQRELSHPGLSRDICENERREHCCRRAPTTASWAPCRAKTGLTHHMKHMCLNPAIVPSKDYEVCPAN